MSGFDVEFEGDFFFEVAVPAIVAVEEGAVFVSIGWERVELVRVVAGAVVLDVLDHVVAIETSDQLELVVLMVVVLLTHLSLLEVEVVPSVADISYGGFEVLHALGDGMLEDSFFEVGANAFHGGFDFAGVLDVELPGFFVVERRVERVKTLVDKVLRLRSVGHFTINKLLIQQ